MSLGYFEIGSQRPMSIPSLDTLMISPFAAMPGMPSVTTKEAFFISILRSKGCLNKGVPLNEGVPLNSDANRWVRIGRVGLFEELRQLVTTILEDDAAHDLIANMDLPKGARENRYSP